MTQLGARTLCNAPLPLALALDIALSRPWQLGEVTDLARLLTEHVRTQLADEVQRDGIPLSVDDRLQHFESLGRLFYDEEGASPSGPSTFARSELLEALKLRKYERSEVVVRALENGALLRIDLGIEQTYRFSHRAYTDLFFARACFHALQGIHGDPVDLLSRFTSASVARLLLEMLSAMPVGSRRRQKAADVTIAALMRVGEQPQASELERARVRIARQQLAYWLGNIGGAAARGWLAQSLQRETDVWIRRGIAIGLALDGCEEPLMAEIDMRRQERAQSARPAPHCESNLGYHLSLCGDQPLDVLAPDKDRGLPSSALTVSTLIRQLNTPQKRGSWRSTLFTFVDLAVHRPVSADSFQAALRRNRAAAEAGLTRAAKSGLQCPELHEAVEIVEAVS